MRGGSPPSTHLLFGDPPQQLSPLGGPRQPRPDAKSLPASRLLRLRAGSKRCKGGSNLPLQTGVRGTHGGPSSRQNPPTSCCVDRADASACRQAQVHTQAGLASTPVGVSEAQASPLWLSSREGRESLVGEGGREGGPGSHAPPGESAER